MRKDKITYDAIIAKVSQLQTCNTLEFKHKLYSSVVYSLQRNYVLQSHGEHAGTPYSLDGLLSVLSILSGKLTKICSKIARICDVENIT